MGLLGRILKNRKSGDAQAAWNLPNLGGPDAADALELTSEDFKDGGTIAKPHWAKYVGGRNLSPQLTWSEPPAGTAQLLLVVEDTDVPQARPAVHCVALIDPAVRSLAAGALAGKDPAPGTTLLRSVIGRGYQGPAPIKGHGPHHYTFQLFALAAPLGPMPDGTAQAKAKPSALLPSITAPVLARGRVIGTVER
jgi:hypothetical protein